MSTVVVLPALGESVVEGKISHWLVKEGDRVERDQPLVEVTTDKVDAEIPSPASGVIERIVVSEGEVVPIGAELARIDREGGTRKESPQQASHSTPPDGGATSEAHTPDGRRDSPRATPLARRMAEDRQLDLREVPPSRAGGRVTKQDIVRHAVAQSDPLSEPAANYEGSSHESRADRFAIGGDAVQNGDRVIPMTPLRKLVAEHMVYSKQTSPHVGTVAEIDMSGVLRVRDRHKAEFRAAHGFGLNYLPFIVQATVRALREFPALNASVLEDAIVEKVGLHIAIAVETENGLVVPVLRHADRLSLVGLALAIEKLAHRARERRLSPDELTGGTFTISNPGRSGNLYGFAIINQPQVGILRVGEIVKRPVVRSYEGDDSIVIRSIMHLALSYDHRAVDGAPANRFLGRVREILEAAEFEL